MAVLWLLSWQGWYCKVCHRVATSPVFTWKCHSNHRRHWLWQRQCAERFGAISWRQWSQASSLRRSSPIIEGLNLKHRGNFAAMVAYKAPGRERRPVWAVGNCRLPAVWMKAYSEVPVLQLCNSLRSVPIGWLWISNWIPQIQPVLHAYRMKTAHEWALVAMTTLASHIWEKVLTSDLWLLCYYSDLAEPWLIPMWVIPVRIPSDVKPIIDRF